MGQAISRRDLCLRWKWWQDPESNRGHKDFQSSALPTELSCHYTLEQRVTLIYRTRDVGLVTLICHRKLPSMETEALGEAKAARKLVFHRVAENLYRLETSGGYYALLKRGDKQFRRSLKTKDRKLADRRLVELRAQVGNLTIGEDARLSFDEVAERWKAATQHGLKPSTVLRRKTCIRNLSPFFKGTTVRHIQPHHCERWLTERGAKMAPQTLVHELDTMRLAASNFFIRPRYQYSNPTTWPRSPAESLVSRSTHG
jgi:integrase-like protein